MCAARWPGLSNAKLLTYQNKILKTPSIIRLPRNLILAEHSCANLTSTAPT
jgi:hypothetical protein